MHCTGIAVCRFSSFNKVLGYNPASTRIALAQVGGNFARIHTDVACNNIRRSIIKELSGFKIFMYLGHNRVPYLFGVVVFNTVQGDYLVISIPGYPYIVRCESRKPLICVLVGGTVFPAEGMVTILPSAFLYFTIPSG